MKYISKELSGDSALFLLGELEEKLAGGLHFSNMLGFANQEKVNENCALLQALLELLVGKGFIHLHEIEKRKAKLHKSFLKNENFGPRVKLTDTPDKYTYQDVIGLDCASHRHLCKGACCSLWFALSVQDLDEQIVKWNYSRPYGIRQNNDGRCIHQDPCTHLCTVYENRPLVCRTYDCRKDKRVWLDYDKAIVNPEIIAEDRIAAEFPDNSKEIVSD